MCVVGCGCVISNIEQHYSILCPCVGVCYMDKPQYYSILLYVHLWGCVIGK